MKICYFVMDNGDGSASVWWIPQEQAQIVRNKSADGEDGWWYAEETLKTLTFPDGFDLKAAGITLDDLTDES